MNKCLKITFSQQKIPVNFLRSFVQKNAQKFNIEGAAQLIAPDKKIRIIACGQKKEVDSFIDILHTKFIELAIRDTSIEPYIKDKNYRNVFRIID